MCFTLSFVYATPNCLYSPVLVVDANRKPTCAVSSSVTEPQSAQIGKSITNHKPKSLSSTHTYTRTRTHMLTHTHMHKQNGSTLHTQLPSIVHTLIKHNGFHCTHTHATLHSVCTSGCSDVPIINSVCVSFCMRECGCICDWMRGDVVSSPA